MQLQVTIFHKTNKYKPISTLVEIPMADVVKKNYQPYKSKAIEKICLKRRWRYAEMVQMGYTKISCRIYDKEKIEEENKRRYEEIKRKKFECGEWKPSKKDIEKGLTNS